MPSGKRRKSSSPATEPVAIAEVLPAVMERAEQHAEPVTPGRPIGPRHRDIEEPRTVYRGPNVTLTLDGGDTYNLESAKPLTREQEDRAIAAGFDAVDEEGKHWQASRRAVLESGKDINVLAIALDGKGERLGHSAGRGR